LVTKVVDEIQPVREDYQELEAEPLTVAETPKRRGRPPLSDEEKERRRLEREATGTYTRRTTKSLASLENRIGAFLFTINVPLQFLVKQDALDPIEVNALAKAINEECTHNATFRKYVETALKVQGTTSLVAVIGIIAGRRVVRHSEQLNITIPDELGGKNGVDAMLGATLQMISTGQPLIQTPTLSAV
jgi:hypothetical protein